MHTITSCTACFNDFKICTFRFSVFCIHVLSVSIFLGNTLIKIVYIADKGQENKVIKI